MGTIPVSGRSPEGGHGKPLQYSCLENPMDREAWWATVHITLRSSLRSPAEGEGHEGFPPPPEEDLESPSLTRLEALVPTCIHSPPNPLPIQAAT